METGDPSVERTAISRSASVRCAEWKEDVRFGAGTGNVDDQTSKARVGDHANDLHFRGLRAAHPESAPNGIVARPDAACAALT